MAVKLKTWVWVVIGVVVVGILGVIAMAGVGLYFASQHIQTESMSSAEAAQTFDDIVKKFEGQKPLIELDARGNVTRANTERPRPANAAAPDSLYVLAFDPDDGRTVRMSLPFWLLRMRPGSTTINFNGNRMDLEDLKLTVEDLERFGPTLIIDQRGANGDRVLVWSQ